MRFLMMLLAVLTLAACNDPGNTASRSPDQIYRGYCSQCHAGGSNGAPRVGPAHRMAWSDEMEEDGFEGLVSAAIHGQNAMPARGTCFDCSDAELRATVIYMLKESGAK
ncbi:cytochrome c5 [Alcanivorax hongdengensis A-11-3]|uniref:Cytochrome c5 n=1 Tax=Alcanivorax hongdengensis A-11-3 TaxID=1177179 RepID=L0WD65_9GAMM|nr:c-type cytochrome [Alcanivorax hongdengensis]EKF73705.1 cytochrome c5 [Alcanivorax hongdengensis A-11-3]